MKLHFLLFLIFIFGSFSFAQTVTPSLQATRNQVQENWQTIAPDNEEFSVETPTPLTPHTFNNTGLKTLIRRNYNGENNGSFFIIFSEPLKDSFQTKEALRFANFFKPVGHEVKLDNLEVKGYKFTDSEDFYHNVIVAKTKTRSYVFQTISEVKDNPQVERFFKSLHLNRSLPASSENYPDNAPVALSSGGNRTVNPPTSNSTPSGISSRSPQPAQLKQTSPLKILSKPRPPYTDWARFFGVSGVVILRLTFQETGEIGVVTIVKKLPFGLTHQAIEVARKIRFEPQTKDGQPISVTRAIEYGFFIY